MAMAHEVEVMALLILVLSVTCSFSMRDELEEFDKMMSEPQDRSHWVDPHDMGLEQELIGGSNRVCSGLIKCNQELTSCRNTLQKLAEEKNSTTSKPDIKKPVAVTTATDVFLKRHVSHLISRLGLSYQASHLKVETMLSQHQVETLHNFVSNRPTVHNVDVVDILASLVRNVETYERTPWLQNLKEHMSSLRDPLLVTFLILSLIYVFIEVGRRLPTSRVFLLFVLSCWSWHWLHLYKATWAAKHSTLLQSGNVPPECRPRDMTWVQTLQSSARSIFSSVDRCEEYHKAIMVDPIYEVNPLTALVDLITRLLFHPLSSFGTEVGLMFSGLLGSVPLIWKVPVLLVFVILLMFCMILCAGYRVRLPLWMGELSPAQSHQPQLPQEEIQELKKLLADSTKQNRAVLEIHNGTTGGTQTIPGSMLPMRQGSVVQSIDLVDSVEEEKKEVTENVSGKGTEDISIKEAITEKVCATVPGTPKKTTQLRKTSLTLTPVRSRVVDEPRILRKNSFPWLEDLDGGLDLRKNGKEDAALDLRSVSPVKSLVVTGDPASPSTTTFDWELPGIKRSEFLEKVEEVFQAPLNEGKGDHNLTYEEED